MSIKQAIQELEAEVVGIETKIATRISAIIQNLREHSEAEPVSAEAADAALTAQVATLTGALATANDHVLELQSQIDTLTQANEEGAAVVARLNEQITALQTPAPAPDAAPVVETPAADTPVA